MGQYGDPEGTFSSVRGAATPADVESYRATPQFAVGAGKLVVMSLCTFGFYQLYWAYKHWDAQRRRENENLSPFWRAFFAPLWGFSLFPRLQRMTGMYGVPAAWSGGALGLAYFLLNLIVRLPDPYWLISLLNFIPCVIAQRSINALNAHVAPEAPRNDTYSGLNVVGILVGGLFLLLAILGTLVTFEEQAAQFPVVT